MIIDNLNNTKDYEHVHPLFKQAFDFLKNGDLSAMPLGKVEIAGDDLFAMISDSRLKAVQEAKLEVHNKYLDIQMPLSGSETMGWKSRVLLEKSLEAFDTERDIQFFEDSISTFFNLEPCNFVIFFPQDGHAPCIGEGSVKKVVIKIKL